MDMESLYKQILNTSRGKKGMIPVDKLIAESGFSSEVTNILIAQGYEVQNMSPREKAILFVALVDIIAVYEGGQYYLATFSHQKVYELHQLGRIIPNTGETDISGVDRLLRLNTQSMINNYLSQGKFHLLKLNIYEKSRTSFTLVSVTSMNPYPTLREEMVYSLTQMANWHNELSNVLVKGIYKLTVSGKPVICQNYLSQTKSVATGGILITKDVNNDLLELPLVEITDYESYSDNDFVLKLYRGVVNYDGSLVTLNRELLEKYYGTKALYTSLESVGVRYRYCLEELLIVGNKWSVAYYINKYDLQIYDCANVYELQSRLRSLVAKAEKPAQGVVNARGLTALSSLKSGHKPFYIRINLAKLDSHKIEVVENVADVMPKVYQYYGISPSLGYNCVEVKATSSSLAEKYGCTEFERQFGGGSYFSGLVCEGALIKGSRGYKFGIDIQRRLCQNIMWGYTQNYSAYSSIVREMLSANGVVSCSDEAIQLLFVNNLARKCKDCGNIKFLDVMVEFIKFCDLASDGVVLEKALNNEKARIAYGRCCKEYKVLNSALPDLKGYDVDSTGKYVTTKYGRYKIGKEGINKTAELLYNGVSLGNKILKG